MLALQEEMSQLMRLWNLSHSSGEPAHPRSLTRAFAVHTHEVWKYQESDI